MDEIKEKQGIDWKGFGLVFYCSFGSFVLSKLLGHIFSISQAVAIGLAILFIGLTSHPLFVRGTPNPWRKNKKQWTFWQWFLGVVIIALISYFFISYFVGEGR